VLRARSDNEEALNGLSRRSDAAMGAGIRQKPCYLVRIAG